MTERSNELDMAALTARLDAFIERDAQGHKLLLDMIETQNARIAALVTGVEYIKADRELVRRLVLGNGDPGLAERVRLVERAVSDGTRMFRWLVAGIIAVVGSFVVEIIRWSVSLGAIGA